MQLRYPKVSIFINFYQFLSILKLDDKTSL